MLAEETRRLWLKHKKETVMEKVEKKKKKEKKKKALIVIICDLKMTLKEDS